MILDGEVIVIDEEGKPDFDALQRYNPSMQLTYFVFDIIWIAGYSLVELPLTDRRAILEAVLPANMVFRLSEQFKDGEKLFQRMQEVDMEGIVTKRKDSKYTPGKKGVSWYKIQTEIRGEYVIGGYTESDSNRPFRSLLFGNYQDGKLMYLGHAGGGYKESEMAKILAKLRKYETKHSPFANDPKVERKTHWLEPKLVANFKFATFTDAGRVRKPAIFLGFRDDKLPKQVVPEIPKKLSTPKQKAPSRRHPVRSEVKRSGDTGSPEPTRLRSIKEPIGSNWTELLKEPISSRGEFIIDDKKLELTNIEKELWPGVSKADLINYYHKVADYMLPHLIDRPLSLHIKHHGPKAPGMYIKDMEGYQPSWAEIFTIGRKHKAAGKRDQIDYLVCQDEATLLYAVNLGCIDINPWTARTGSPFSPDFVIIDLDPSDNDFSKAIKAARATKTVLDRYKLKGYVKTSGKTGIHIYIPVVDLTFGEARKAATFLCEQIHQLLPDITTTEISVSKRGDKLYLDPNQNDQADTVAAPYSVRPSSNPTVSTPLEWREVNAKLDPAAFDITTVLARIEKKGDLFAEAISGKYNLGNSKRLRGLL
jgi:bifunctional non-homologous end joining protein LigD